MAEAAEHLTSGGNAAINTVSEAVPNIVTENMQSEPAISLSANASPPAGVSSGLYDSVMNFFQGNFGKYQNSLKENPLETKMITSCIISILGEIIGSYIKQNRYRDLMAANRNNSRYTLAKMPPIIDFKRIAIFGTYGLAITGPIFHWWYGFLERTVRGWDITGNLNVLTKIALDRLILTPPFLLLTLVYMQFLQTFSVAKTSAAVKNIYASALYLNWRVWTPAQAVNFKFVPLEYRVLFGNLVALWWNIALSLKN
jgi:hypothetical protein